MIIRNVIIPAAGKGVRFLPASKAVPKEMLPLVDKPAIQYVIEEALSSGIDNTVFITNHTKSAIAEHFSYDAHSTSSFGKNSSFSFIHQTEPLGLGHAVWSARNAIHDDYFSVMLPDEIMVGKAPCMALVNKVAMQEKCNIIAVQEVPADQVSSYGIIEIKRQFSPSLFQVKDLIEKPSKMMAPSNLAIVGRYVLSTNIFDALDNLAYDAHNEIQLTDGIRELIKNGEKVFALKVSHERYDVGSPLGWLKANIALSLQHPRYGHHMLSYLESLDRDMILLQGQARLSKGNSFAR